MRPPFWFTFGFFTALVIVMCAGIFGLATAVHGFSTNAAPTVIESWTARQARSFALSPDAKQSSNPVPNTPGILAEARAHWADHCAVCHANDGSGTSEMGRNMYPPAPNMRASRTQQLTDGELFYVIQNGIRLSGMPGWGSDHAGEEDSWKLVRFIRHLPHLSDAELQEMEKLNPKGPEELEEEKEEKQFLSGDTPSTSSSHSHRHQ